MHAYDAYIKVAVTVPQNDVAVGLQETRVAVRVRRASGGGGLDPYYAALPGAVVRVTVRDDEAVTVSRRTVGAAEALLSRAYSDCPAEGVMENNVVEEKGGAEGRSGETICQQSSAGGQEIDSDADVVI